jgi:carbon storage regulator
LGCAEEAQHEGTGETMLVLSRKIGERILIGDKISVTVVRIAGNAVRIGVEAPADLTVLREELKTELDGEDDPESKYQHAAP